MLVTGEGWADGCSDTGGPPSPPIRHLVIAIDSGEGTTHLADVAANDDYSFAVTVVVPDGMVAGPATLTASYRGFRAAAAQFTVTPEQLPFTGMAHPLRTTAAGLLFVLLGAVLLGLAAAGRAVQGPIPSLGSRRPPTAVPPRPGHPDSGPAPR